jgi:dephospho-CoA kinase
MPKSTLQRRIAITGGAGSGKSSVLRRIAQEGVQVASSDDIVRRLREVPEVQAELLRFTGEPGPYDLARIRTRAFADAEYRRRLEAFFFPLVEEELERGTAQVVEVPLLVEAGWQDRFTHVWVLSCSRETQLQRLLQRPGLSREIAEQILASQLTDAERRRVATRVIDTDCPWEITALQVELGLREDFFSSTPLLFQDGLRFAADYHLPLAVWVPLLERIAAAYDTAGRSYHNREHVEELIELARRYWDGGFTSPQFFHLYLAILFHDFVYDPRSATNEADSARVAREETKPLPGVDPELLERLILVTRTHEASTELEQFLVDLDLAILGADPDRYREYAQAIRQEYAHVPEDAYRTGRSAVLQRFLDRPRIYGTPRLHHRCEAQARENLRWELEQLGNGQRHGDA